MRRRLLRIAEIVPVDDGLNAMRCIERDQNGDIHRSLLLLRLDGDSGFVDARGAPVPAETFSGQVDGWLADGGRVRRHYYRDVAPTPTRRPRWAEATDFVAEAAAGSG